MRAVPKPLAWVGNALDVVRGFPAGARQVIGQELRRVQAGLEPGNWKPMASVGPGAREIRIQAEGAYRVLYVANFSEAVYVLHAFEKRTQRTPAHFMEVARRRLRAVVRERRRGRGTP